MLKGFLNTLRRFSLVFRETVGYSYTLLSIYFSLFVVYSKLFHWSSYLYMNNFLFRFNYVK